MKKTKRLTRREKKAAKDTKNARAIKSGEVNENVSVTSDAPAVAAVPTQKPSQNSVCKKALQKLQREPTKMPKFVQAEKCMVKKNYKKDMVNSHKRAIRILDSNFDNMYRMRKEGDTNSSNNSDTIVRPSQASEQVADMSDFLAMDLSSSSMSDAQSVQDSEPIKQLFLPPFSNEAIRKDIRPSKARAAAGLPTDPIYYNAGMDTDQLEVLMYSPASIFELFFPPRNIRNMEQIPEDHPYKILKKKQTPSDLNIKDIKEYRCLSIEDAELPLDVLKIDSKPQRAVSVTGSKVKNIDNLAKHIQQDAKEASIPKSKRKKVKKSKIMLDTKEPMDESEIVISENTDISIEISSTLSKKKQTSKKLTVPSNQDNTKIDETCKKSLVSRESMPDKPKQKSDKLEPEPKQSTEIFVVKKLKVSSFDTVTKEPVVSKKMKSTKGIEESKTIHESQSKPKLKGKKLEKSLKNKNKDNSLGNQKESSIDNRKLTCKENKAPASIKASNTLEKCTSNKNSDTIIPKKTIESDKIIDSEEKKEASKTEFTEEDYKILAYWSTKESDEEEVEFTTITSKTKRRKEKLGAAQKSSEMKKIVKGQTSKVEVSKYSEEKRKSLSSNSSISSLTTQQEIKTMVIEKTQNEFDKDLPSNTIKTTFKERKSSERRDYSCSLHPSRSRESVPTIQRSEEAIGERQFASRTFRRRQQKSPVKQNVERTFTWDHADKTKENVKKTNGHVIEKTPTDNEVSSIQGKNIQIHEKEQFHAIKSGVTKVLSGYTQAKTDKVKVSQESKSCSFNLKPMELITRPFKEQRSIFSGQVGESMKAKQTEETSSSRITSKPTIFLHSRTGTCDTFSAQFDASTVQKESVFVKEVQPKILRKDAASITEDIFFISSSSEPSMKSVTTMTDISYVSVPAKEPLVLAKSIEPKVTPNNEIPSGKLTKQFEAAMFEKKTVTEKTTFLKILRKDAASMTENFSPVCFSPESSFMQSIATMTDEVVASDSKKESVPLIKDSKLSSTDEPKQKIILKASVPVTKPVQLQKEITKTEKPEIEVIKPATTLAPVLKDTDREVKASKDDNQKYSTSLSTSGKRPITSYKNILLTSVPTVYVREESQEPATKMNYKHVLESSFPRLTPSAQSVSAVDVPPVTKTTMDYKKVLTVSLPKKSTQTQNIPEVKDRTFRRAPKKVLEDFIPKKSTSKEILSEVYVKKNPIPTRDIPLKPVHPLRESPVSVQQITKSAAPTQPIRKEYTMATLAKERSFKTQRWQPQPRFFAPPPISSIVREEGFQKLQEKRKIAPQQPLIATPIITNPEPDTLPSASTALEQKKPVKRLSTKYKKLDFRKPLNWADDISDISDDEESEDQAPVTTATEETKNQEQHSTTEKCKDEEHCNVEHQDQEHNNTLSVDEFCRRFKVESYSGNQEQYNRDDIVHYVQSSWDNVQSTANVKYSEDTQ